MANSYKKISTYNGIDFHLWPQNITTIQTCYMKMDYWIRTEFNVPLDT